MSSKIRSCALNLLARREHSKLELQHKLQKYGFAAYDIKKLIQDLASQGLQSDSRFVEGYVNMRAKRGFGPIRILAELNERGIDKEQGASFLSNREHDWFALAKSVQYKKFGSKIPRDLNMRAKQMRYLSYKGFTSDHIKATLSDKYEEDL